MYCSYPSGVPALRSRIATNGRGLTNTTTYTVHGMSCGHCVAAITDEVVAVEHVTGVAVDLPAGKVTVTSDQPLDDATLTAVIAAAGYAVVP
ncbi:MAG: hypothetical protein QOF40_222 [Actinomycetota bacterium]|nr:hypothetical protein [Actinomycetota bacterium]